MLIGLKLVGQEECFCFLRGEIKAVFHKVCNIPSEKDWENISCRQGIIRGFKILRIAGAIPSGPAVKEKGRESICLPMRSWDSA